MFMVFWATRRRSSTCAPMATLRWRNARTRFGREMQRGRMWGRFWRLRQRILRNWLGCGREFMGKHKVVTTDAEIDRALLRAGALEGEPRVVAVEYRPGAGLDLLILKLSDGRREIIPSEDLRGLERATREEVERGEVL